MRRSTEPGKKKKAHRDLETLEQRQTDYEKLHESGMDMNLLSEAFSNITENEKTGRLVSLSLEVVVYRKDAEQRLPLLLMVAGISSGNQQQINSIPRFARYPRPIYQLKGSTYSTAVNYSVAV